MKHFISIIFSFLFSNLSIIYGQVNENDLGKLSLKELSSIFYNKETSKQLQLKILPIFLEKAKQDVKKPINIAVAYYMYSQISQTEKAISYMDSVIKYSIDKKDEYFPLAAYRDKAYLLRKLYRYDEVIDNYMIAENLAKKTNIDFYYKIKLDIAELKSEEFSEVEEALQLYRICQKYYEKQNTNKNNYFYCYNQTLFDLADAHKTLKNSDSCTYYNIKGYKNCIITNDDYYKYLFVLNEGANQVSKKNFMVAIDSIKKALPKMIEFENTINVIAGYYYLGKANLGLGNKKKAVENFKLLDSIYQTHKDIYPEFIDGYSFLIKHYKEIGDKENQLIYTNKLMHIDSLMQKKYKNFNKSLYKKYEIPHLIENKNTVIESLKSKISIIVIISTICIIGFILYNYLQNKTYKKRFDSLLQEQKNKIETNLKLPEKDIKDTDIGEKNINYILEQLEDFENKKEYLNTDLNIQLLADKFKINVRYVSKTINDYKQKNFIQYINDLRIEYALDMLKSNSKYRKYKMLALANEFGFNTAESFSNAFFKKTGIKPSFYIKELKKLSDC